MDSLEAKLAILSIRQDQRMSGMRNVTAAMEGFVKGFRLGLEHRKLVIREKELKR